MISSGFIWILLASGAYGLLHSLLASLKAKDLAERCFGTWVRRWYRLFFNLQAVLTLLPVLALYVVLPDAPLYRIPLPWAMLTYLVQLLSAAGMLAGVFQTGAWLFAGFSQISQPGGDQPPVQLVTGGFYRYVRHPLYTFGLLILWLNPIMTWNTLALNLGATAYILIGIVFEEKKLLKEFGAAYAEYQKRTPVLIPFLKLK